MIPNNRVIGFRTAFIAIAVTGVLAAYPVAGKYMFSEGMIHKQTFWLGVGMSVGMALLWGGITGIVLKQEIRRANKDE